MWDYRAHVILLEGKKGTFDRGGNDQQVAALPIEQVKQQLRGNLPPLILDVHTPEEFAGELGHISQAMNVPVTDLSPSGYMNWKPTKQRKS